MPATREESSAEAFSREATTANNWHLQSRAIAVIEEAREEGIDVEFDCYPYVAGSSVLTQVLPQSALDGGPFWWQGPDGGKVLMWYSRHYMQMQYLFGLPSLMQTGEEVLPLFLQVYQRPGYRASATIVFGLAHKLRTLICFRNKVIWRMSGTRSTHTLILSFPDSTMPSPISQSSSGTHSLLCEATAVHIGRMAFWCIRNRT
jgi:hypothetical protein